MKYFLISEKKLEELIKYSNAGKILVHVDSQMAIELKKLRKNGIDLSDDTIEEKAEVFADDQWKINGRLISREHKIGWDFAKDAYSQALKDLIK